MNTTANAPQSRTPVQERDEPSVSSAAHAAEMTTPRRHPWRKFLLALVLLAGLVWAVRYAHELLTHATTDNAYVTAHIHQVSSRVAGTVTEVSVEENTDVHAGDILARLDPRDADSKIVQAEALLALAQAKVTQAESELTNTRAKTAQAEAQAQKAELDFHRTRDLAQTKVASKQELDAAQATYTSDRAGLDSARAGIAASDAALVAAQAQLRTAEAYLADARLQHSYTVITAPVSGHVGKRNIEVGNRVQSGQALVAIIEPEVWIEANFKETQLAKMHVGQSVEITIDALPSQHFRGTVESVSPASGAQFAMLPPDNATGNFTKVVQRVPVRVRFDAESIRGFDEKLRAGLSAVVAVRLD